MLLFFGHALEGRTILFHIHKAACIRIAFYPLFGSRVINLTTIFNGSVAVTVSFWWICCHINYIFDKSTIAKRILSAL
jgi:hypothetical protein